MRYVIKKNKNLAPKQLIELECVPNGLGENYNHDDSPKLLR
jgi:hypothetical protein